MILYFLNVEIFSRSKFLSYFNTCAMESIPDDGVGPKNRTIDVNKD